LSDGVVFKALPEMAARAELVLAYPRRALSPAAMHFRGVASAAT